MAKPRHRLLVLSGHTLFREAIESVLVREYEIISEVNQRGGVAGTTGSHSFDIAIIELGVGPSGGGIPQIERLRQQQPDTKLVVVGGFMDWDVCRAAFAAGADGYLVVQSDVGELQAALTTVRSGGRYVTPRLGCGPDEMRSGGKATRLSALDILILEHLAQGLTCREVAHAIGRTQRTVRHHMSEIRRKCGVETAEVSPWRRIAISFGSVGKGN